MTRWAFLILATLALPAQAEGFSSAQKQQIETIVHDYLVKNPEVLRESFLALQKQEQEHTQASQKKAIDDNSKLLTDSDKHGIIGNPQGDVTLVIFFDYNCGYCRAADADLQRLIKEDLKLRVVLKEFPVLGLGSMEAALISAQLIKDVKYAAFHHALLGSKGTVDKTRALDAAKNLGLDTAKLEKGLKEDSTRAIVQESYKLAEALTINGTPAYILGQDVFPGAQPYDMLKTAIANMRKCGKAEC